MGMWNGYMVYFLWIKNKKFKIKKLRCMYIWVFIKYLIKFLNNLIVSDFNGYIEFLEIYVEYYIIVVWIVDK